MSGYDFTDATSRNRGIISAKGQESLARAVIAVAGCGGAGGATAVQLARMGVSKFRLADPDVISISNINRQEGAFLSTEGINKADVISRCIIDINPNAEVVVFKDGVSELNVEAFLAGATLGLEEIDYRKPWFTRLVHKTAERLRLPLITGIPVAWNTFTFLFDYGNPKSMPFDEYVGLNPEKVRSGEYKSYDIKITAFAPELPIYLGASVIRDVIAEKIEIPAVGPGIAINAGQTAAFVYFFLSGTREVKPVPFYYASGDLFLKPASRVGTIWDVIWSQLRNAFRGTQYTGKRNAMDIQREAISLAVDENEPKQ